LLLLASLSLAVPVHADGLVGNGTAASCTEAALAAALAAGGTITFNCGGGKTFTFTSEKTITQDTVIEGGNAIYFNGGSATRLFRVVAPARLTLNDLYLQKGYSPGADGGAILSLGTLVLNNVRAENNAAGGCGGVIWTQGAVIVSNSRFENNSAVIGGGAICTAAYGGANLQISNTRLQYNGVAQAGNNAGYGGAIVLNPTASLTFTDSEFSSNKAQFGGALAVMQGATATVRSTLVAGSLAFHVNSATHSGGAAYNLGSLSLDTTQVGRNYIDESVTVNGYGGGIASLGALTIHNSFFFSNYGRIGGGLYLAGGLDSSRADLQRVELQGNEAKVAGGGLFADTTALTVTNSTFYNNRAAGSGGALGCASCTRLQVSNSSFITNTAAYGGGLYVTAGNESKYSIVQNATFSGNTASSSRGGGVYNQGLLELRFTTLAYNGNGVHNGPGASTRFRSSVLHNPGYTNCGSDSVTQFNNDGANHVSDDSCGPAFTAAGDPRLGPLQFDIQDKYWDTHFRLPLVGSPLINLGHSTCPERDQRGALRPNACDIGAVEFGGMLPRLFLPLAIR
jgi:hypothetical protein